MEEKILEYPYYNKHSYEYNDSDMNLDEVSLSNVKEYLLPELEDNDKVNENDVD
ncbi:1021_t:CDS:2 [Funneliformis caledonium]|uniref:1021_t:CDS:1 n=1 Tax=Funneliformis caledonium TaxID=1117310 RepID=A0A9N9NLJ8_9GLOM|nr:1021_t:CDS:2 [Funneliformis caledonium]